MNKIGLIVLGFILVVFWIYVLDKNDKKNALRHKKGKFKRLVREINILLDGLRERYEGNFKDIDKYSSKHKDVVEEILKNVDFDNVDKLQEKIITLQSILDDLKEHHNNPERYFELYVWLPLCKKK